MPPQGPSATPTQIGPSQMFSRFDLPSTRSHSSRPPSTRTLPSAPPRKRNIKPKLFPGENRLLVSEQQQQRQRQLQQQQQQSIVQPGTQASDSFKATAARPLFSPEEIDAFEAAAVLTSWRNARKDRERQPKEKRHSI